MPTCRRQQIKATVQKSFELSLAQGCEAEHEAFTACWVSNLFFVGWLLDDVVLLKFRHLVWQSVWIPFDCFVRPVKQSPYSVHDAYARY